MTFSEFVEKWRNVSVTERSAAQTHFNELCELLGVDKPLDVDPEGTFYTFERHVSKATGGKGFADVWKKDHFAWEYKGKRKNLQDAYLQLLLYRDDLDNPPLLIVSDIDRIEIHTNFTGATKQVIAFSLDDLLDAGKLAQLRQVFTNPDAFNPKHQRERVTEEATAKIGAIALGLRARGFQPERVAHFMMQLVFALFAEDSGLLPNRLVTKILDRTGDNPERAKQYLSMLFQAMSKGGEVLLEDVEHFNGGLFDGSEALLLESTEIAILHQAAQLDWAEVEPAIFGTLFERSLDPQKRGQLGAHYTSREDILRIVDPVVVRPLRERWAGVREEVEKRLKRGHHLKAQESVSTFLNELHQIRVLDPACGSGNFLYVAMQQLKDLEREVVTLAQSIGAPGFMLIGPKQFHGIEVNVFAQELASMVVWIGYLQWNRANGISNAQRPILEPLLQNIRRHDALMDDDGSDFEWPRAEFIIGNPPFIGGKKMRSELGDTYVDRLFATFDERVPREADFVTYWFEKSRSQIESGRSRRAGLIATNSIRGGANRKVLERVKETGDLFMAWSDEPWILEGAAVRVSMIGFDDGSQQAKTLNGEPVSTIYADLTSKVDVSKAKVLKENKGISFMGTTKGGSFDIPGELAHSWLELPNPSGCSNGDVVKPWVNGLDLTRRPRDMWIIDFGGMSEAEAAEYVVPFEYARDKVLPERIKGRDEKGRVTWWLFLRSRPDMRAALSGLSRYVATARVAKYRLFVWLNTIVVPDSQVIAIARDDDFAFGVLHSKLHELWSLKQGTSLGKGNDPRYTPTTCFETFPFPHPSFEQRCEIEKWAKHLDQVRNNILNCDEKLTLTKLYNELDHLRRDRDSGHKAYPLLVAHERLDAAVAAAYDWDWPMEEEEILKRLLKLNSERAASEASAS
jgi:type II restriction/modification system DNA methylase subunit YeeA